MCMYFFYIYIIYRWEEQGYADKSIWQTAGEYGILGVNIPAEHGGLGGTFLDTAVVMEEM